ncbi:RIP metalloprotease RseP [Sulfurovum sp. zt1-1]|uniref:Zinc metalloprotease n=1 Tax=Sulfurovum zhangzhouensis TaxID=3019067 RepID=A0ABT7R0H2_9BACT|nr:RIP metalloprotease RseP [Sulfurovum zhangzhouensis]MDM5272001.1 RIP metalloprotease RseP [Sulfurovum zhangzhouensis]
MSVIIALLVLSVLIFFHELGHFLAARFFGVKVEVFSIGFGKKLFTKKIGDTLWSISTIPLGGYVKMKGQDDSDPTKVSYDSDSYTTKKPWQRIVILLAGPFANFFTAFVLYFAVSQIGTHLSPVFNYAKYMPATIGSFAPDSPAKEAGLDINDTIVQINHIKIKDWENIGEAIQTADHTLSLTVIRDGALMNFDFSPVIQTQKNKFGEDIQRKLIGVGPLVNQEKLHFSLLEGIQFAWNETLYASMLIFQSVEKLITGAIGADKLGGILTIVDVTAQASNIGIVALFLFTALISVNLGVLNLLPIPALDGGHIIFNLYEWIRGKAPNEAAMYYMTVTGWGILISLMLLGLYNDINRLFG